MKLVGELLFMRERSRGTVVANWQGAHLAWIDEVVCHECDGRLYAPFWLKDYLVEVVHYDFVHNWYLLRRCTSVGILQSWLWLALHRIERAKPHILRQLARWGLCAFPRRGNIWQWDLLLWRR